MEQTIYSNHGQILAYFKTNFTKGSLYHASLLVGAESKTLCCLALELSKVLLCPLTCGTCSVCAKIEEQMQADTLEKQLHPDIFQVFPGEKKHITIAQIRSLSDEAALKPWEMNAKIFLIHASDKMGIEAANALLKILEEPAPQTLFILTAENIQAIPDTIVSRCQVFKLGIGSVDDTIESLVVKYNIPREQAFIATTLANGNIDKSLEVIEKYWDIRKILLQVMTREQDAITLSEEIVSFCGSGEEGRQKSLVLLSYMSSLLRDILILQTLKENSAPWIINKDYIRELEKCAFLYTPTKINSLFAFLLKSKKMIECNVVLSLLWENIAISVHC